MKVTIQLSPYAVLQSMVDEAAKVGPEGPFEELPFIASLVLASYGDSRQRDNATFAAYCLSQMDDEDRNDVMTQVEIPSMVWQQMNGSELPAWPFQTSTEEVEEQPVNADENT